VGSMSWPKGLSVQAGGHGVVSHAGPAAVRLLADRAGLTGGLSQALARRGFDPVHDRGPVITDLAVAIADGATAISDIDALRHQDELLGPVASGSAAWRALSECNDRALARISKARAKARSHVRDLVAARHGQIPPARAAGRDPGDVTVVRPDATIVIAHSDKQQARGTFKGTWGFRPLTAWRDNTGESLAVLLRPGNAGSSTAADHLAVADAAIAQIPARYRRKMLFTCDGAGATHALVNHISKLNARRGCQVHFPAGLDFDERIRGALPELPGSAWVPALDADGKARQDAQVAELTGLLRHSAGGDRYATWPPDMRLLVRRENPHPGRPSVPVRAARGQEIPGHRHQHPHRPGPVPRSPPQNPGPGRGPHPLRQGHRPAAPAIPQLRHQHRVVPGRLHRLRPARLAPPPRPGRRPGKSRTENPALPVPSRSRADRQRPAAPLPAHPRQMALDPRHHRSLHQDHGPAPAMTGPPRPSHPGRIETQPAAEPAPTRRDSRAGTPRRTPETKIKTPAGQPGRPAHHTREESRLMGGVLYHADWLGCSRSARR
jgi:hypothetical protein